VLPVTSGEKYRLERVDFAGGPGAKAQDESTISSLCNKVNCVARENALGCNAIRQKMRATNGAFLSMKDDLSS